MGLLGAMVAGGAKGYADQRIKSIEQQEAFDMKRELLAAEEKKALRLQQSGIKLKEEADERERQKVGLILKDTKDPNADKGGYETDEMKVKAKRAELERGVEALRKAGRLDDAKSLTADLAAMDKSELNLAKQEAALRKIENEFTYKSNLLDLKGKQVELQGEANAARMDAASARLSASKDKRSEKREMYDAYVERIKRKGGPDGKGGTSKIPLGFDEWDEKREERAAARKADKGSTQIEFIDGEEASRKETFPRTSTPKAKAADKPVRKYIPGKGFQ